ncbi:MAG: hypothetical protein ACI8T1_004896 [Verrucomicrobiales bacterium]|jgi:hypothetical protein
MFQKLLSLLSSSEWIVRFEKGSPTIEKGTFPPKFVSECADLLAEAGVKNPN